MAEISTQVCQSVCSPEGWWLSGPGTALPPLRCFDILSEFKRIGPLLATQLHRGLHADSNSGTSSCLPEAALTFCLLLCMEWVRVHRLPVLPARELIYCAASFRPPLSLDTATCGTCTHSGVKPQERLRGSTVRRRWSHCRRRHSHHSLCFQLMCGRKDTEQSHRAFSFLKPQHHHNTNCIFWQYTVVRLDTD